MTPTPEQIWAAIEAFHKDKLSKTLEQRMANALTAAAGVVTEQHIEKARTEAHDDWIAKVGKTQGPDSFHPDLVARHAAAGVGDSFVVLDEGEYLDDVIGRRNATIERCAQVAEDWGLGRVNQTVKDYPATCAAAIAYAIRALKDKPIK